MIRSLIIISNLFIALIINLLADGPTAVVKVPPSVKAGESFLMEVTIKTNGEKDFLRYSILLPNAWSAEQVENDGGTFKFDKHTVAVKWLSVSGKTELKISFRVKVPSDASGDFTLTNKISHPVNNQPSNIDLDPVLVSVVSNSAGTIYNTTHTIPDSTAKPPASVSIERVVPLEPVTKGEFIVTLTIHKEDLTSFGKIEDTLPAGFTAKLIKSDGADFKFENGVARFGWYAGLPKKSTINVQYKVIVSPDVEGNQSIGGHFSYVENEKGNVIDVPTSIVVIKQPEVIVQNTITTTENNSTTSTSNSNTSSDNSTNKTDNSTAKNDNTDNSTNNNSNSSNVATTPSNNPDTTNTSDNSAQLNAKAISTIVFKVQIAAMVRMVPIYYFKNTFHISGTIDAEQDNGLNKYLTGTFGTYQDARNHRNDIRVKGVSDAFVTAYNSGKRITVQEALMITNQKWVL